MPTRAEIPEFLTRTQPYPGTGKGSWSPSNTVMCWQYLQQQKLLYFCQLSHLNACLHLGLDSCFFCRWDSYLLTLNLFCFLGFGPSESLFNWEGSIEGSICLCLWAFWCCLRVYSVWIYLCDMYLYVHVHTFTAAWIHVGDESLPIPFVLAECFLVMLKVWLKSLRSILEHTAQ